MRFLIWAFCLLFFGELQAQKYNTAAGLRIGGGLGLTVQQRVGEKITVEGIIQKKLLRKHTHFTALGEFHQPIIGKGVNLYFGAGPNFLFATEYDNDKSRDVQKIYPGASAIAGLELPLGRTLLSADIKPSISPGAGKLLDSDVGISLRYIIVKRPNRLNRLSEKFPFLQKKRNR